MKKFFLLPLVLVAFTLGACETLQNNGTKQTLGGATGAVLGGVLGSKIGDGNGQLWATGAGVLLGAFIGSEVGKSLDRADRAYLGEANRKAQSAPIGESVAWSNPESGHYGSVTPVRDGRSSQGRYCREYEQTIYVDGRQETATGQACQNSDGTWEILS